MPIITRGIELRNRVAVRNRVGRKLLSAKIGIGVISLPILRGPNDP